MPDLEVPPRPDRPPATGADADLFDWSLGVLRLPFSGHIAWWYVGGPGTEEADEAKRAFKAHVELPP